MIESRENFHQILNDFDFEKVQKVMTFLDWKWGNKVPNVWDLERTCLDLYRMCLTELYLDPDCKDMEASTGGFTVKVHKNKFMEIDFCLEKAYVENYDE